MSKIALKATEKHAEAPCGASDRQENTNTAPGALKIIHRCHHSCVTYSCKGSCMLYTCIHAVCCTQCKGSAITTLRVISSRDHREHRSNAAASNTGPACSHLKLSAAQNRGSLVTQVISLCTKPVSWREQSQAPNCCVILQGCKTLHEASHKQDSSQCQKFFTARNESMRSPPARPEIAARAQKCVVCRAAHSIMPPCVLMVSRFSGQCVCIMRRFTGACTSSEPALGSAPTPHG